MENTRQLISVHVRDSATQEKLLAEGHEHLGYFGCLSGNFRLFSPKNAPRVNVPKTNALFAVFSKDEAEMHVRKDSTLLGTTTMMDGKFAWILTVGKLLKDSAEVVSNDAPASVKPTKRLIDAAPALLAELEREYIELADVHNNWPGRDTHQGQEKLCRLRDLIVKASGRSAQEVQDDYGARAAKAGAQMRVAQVTLTQVAPGSMISVAGKEYRLVKASCGGYNLQGSDGRFVLSQPVYPDGLPTMNDLNRMLKYLPTSYLS